MMIMFFTKMQVGLKGEFSMIYSPEKQGFSEWGGMQKDDIQSPFTWYKVNSFFATYTELDGIQNNRQCYNQQESSTTIYFI